MGALRLMGKMGSLRLMGVMGNASLDEKKWVMLGRRVERLRSLAYYIVWAIQKTKEASSQMASFKLLG